MPQIMYIEVTQTRTVRVSATSYEDALATATAMFDSGHHTVKVESVDMRRD